MGTKRIVDVELWNDEKIELYTPEEKYFWLFLLTNPHSNQLGIYHITYKQMSFYLGYDIETCKKLVDRFENEHKTIKYIDNELAIKNYLNYSVITGGKPVEELLKKCIKSVKSKELINWVFGHLNLKDLNNSVVSIINDYQNANENENENYVSYHDTPNDTCHDSLLKLGTYQNVKMTNEQFDKLKAEFPNDYEEWINRVSLYCQSKGKKYKDYLATIRNWARKDKANDNNVPHKPNYAELAKNNKEAKNGIN